METEKEMKTASVIDKSVSQKISNKTKSSPLYEHSVVIPIKSLASMSSKKSAFNQFMKEHQHCLNLEYPDLNLEGMLWFRDDEVQIDNSFNSVLTIYHSLMDPKDLLNMKLNLDVNDYGILNLIKPNGPTYVYMDIDKMYDREKENKDPEIVFFTEIKIKSTRLK